VPTIIPGKDKATNFKFGRYSHRVHPNKSPLKFWRKWSVGVSRDCPIFCVPPIMSGTGKATNFNFCTHILTIDRNKSLLQICGKGAGCVVRTFKTFQGTHILGASRGLLCDSSAVLFRCVVARTIPVHPTAEVSEEVNRKSPARNTMVQHSTPYTDLERYNPQHHRRTDKQTDRRQITYEE